jgi:hypothetical protein
LKPFYEGWTVELTASVELAEPIYEAWACDVLSQWDKTKALIERQPNKKIRFAFFFPYLLFFAFYFIFVIFLHSFSFISILRTMLCLKCRSIEIILIFFVVFQKQNPSFIFWTLIGLWEYEYYVWELVEIDRWKYKLNEWVCMQVLKFN